jgi:hypothetical protein
MTDDRPTTKASGVPGLPRYRAAAAPALAVLVGWALMLYLAPYLVGVAVGAVPVRIISSGILFDQTAVSLNGYRLIIWSPLLTGLLLVLLALKRRPTSFLVALGLVGATVAGTLLVAGAGLGIGPGATLLVGTELRWVWKLCAVAGGIAVGLVGSFLIRARAEDQELDFAAIKRDLLLAGGLLGMILLLAAPGPLLGKAMTGAGSWLGSLVWVLAM